MENIRELLKNSLGQSLQALDDADRLAAAWPIASGKAMSGRASVVGYADGILRLEAVNEAWMREMMSIKGRLASEMSHIAKVPVREIHIEMKRNHRS